jgi:adenosylcobinamide kinase/adenosylcobinamide-phosphate guanylyltransferase
MLTARPRVVLVGGGVRSGKSSFALARARAIGARRLFLATARAYDAEMEDRIARHRAERAGEFETVEVPIELPEAIGALSGRDVAVVDCLTLWLSNLLIDGTAAAVIEARVEALARALRAPACPVVLVTNEVGMGVHPETSLGRSFRDLAGRAHQRLAREADELYLAALGTILRLRPGPVEVVTPGERE